MSYEKHTWETGETITAEKLNNLEDGVASGDEGGNVEVVTITKQNDNTYIADKTYSQLLAASNQGKICVACVYNPFYGKSWQNIPLMVNGSYENAQGNRIYFYSELNQVNVQVTTVTISSSGVTVNDENYSLSKHT